jgi:hypothetical protein
LEGIKMFCAATWRFSTSLWNISFCYWTAMLDCEILHALTLQQFTEVLHLWVLNI